MLRLVKVQAPSSKFQVPTLVLGIWVLGFGIFAFAQEQRGSLGTIGALGQEVKRPPVNNAPAPRLPDGTVSLDGLWVGGGPVNDIAQGLPKGEKLPLKPEAVKILAERAQHETDDPHLWCMPMGVPRSTPYPFRFVQDITGSAASPHLFIIHEGNIHSYRQIFMDGRKHPAELDPTWFGHSIGRWENKDTLVIDTVGFNDKFWFDSRGTPHTEKLHTIERFSRPNFGTLINDFTIDDPGAYSRTVQLKFTARRVRQDVELMEFVCTENNQAGIAGGYKLNSEQR
jgi:hypothetical protein